MEIYEIEGKKGRKLTGINSRIVFIISALMSIFQVYFVGIGVMDPWLFRAGHLTFALVIIFLITPATKKSKKNGYTRLDLVFALASIIVFLYIAFNLDSLNMRAGVCPTSLDIVFAIVTILLVLEAARRYFGPVLPIVAGVFIIYAYFGRYIPGDFKTPSYSLERIASYLFSTTGIYGVAISTSATYVFLFVLFGAFLVETGVGDVFMDLAKAIAGRFRGGPAKVAVISSAFFGSVSGSASSNVVTTGTFTIPLMKKTGFESYYAAAIETTASIGGLFLPPIMGAGGFLMADVLQIPYLEVAKAAIIPALLYYVVLFILIDFETVRLNLKGIPKEELPKVGKIIKEKGYLLIPIFVLLFVLLIKKASPIRAAIWSMISCIVVSWVKPDTRIGIKKLIDILSKGARQALNVVVATACAGIIVGVVQMTGVGLTFSSLLMSLGGTSIILSLLLAMVVSIVLGMGLPITATYITASAILAPALIDLGIEPIAAHLFLYFFSACSGMTPPVCVTAFAASGISGDNPMKVGLQAVKLGWAAYVLPYMFVFGTPLLLIGTGSQVLVSVATALIGCVNIASALHGVLKRKLFFYERLLLVISGILLIEVGAVTNYIGFGLLILFIFMFKINNKKVIKIEE